MPRSSVGSSTVWSGKIGIRLPTVPPGPTHEEPCGPRQHSLCAMTSAKGVVVHYHEIGLKGRNRGFFERQLVTNVERSVRDFPGTKVEMLNGRLLVHTSEAHEELGE